MTGLTVRPHAIAAARALRAARDRVMAAHRRHTSANGDALAGALTRRGAAQGARRTLLRYWDRRHRPADIAEVHVR
ncbi:hypothetical protein NLX86_23060 [Streptomyces sp. A3M-1-3]|uniref:hypothetical protein n=1 Tax=Streptomyces sp. A3M-1-3 TaxID=2962044 RepID=UPI0020B7DC24|nr:hypothetical protein [Streptomyces sp. A3M-1-3]MCP3820868.1 hypothetical protein [Streptomyces sp. A3M-1-3]